MSTSLPKGFHLDFLDWEHLCQVIFLKFSFFYAIFYCIVKFLNMFHLNFSTHQNSNLHFTAYQNRKDSLIKQADNLKNKKAVPKKKRNLDLPPAPQRSKGSSISKQSRKMMRDLVNAKPIANYVKKPVSKPKDENSQAKKVTKEPDEKKQEKLDLKDDSGDIVDGDDKLDRESKLS